MKTISPQSLVAMDSYAAEYKLRVDLAYARGDNDLFGERIYRENARLWLHWDLARVVLKACKACYEQHGYRFVLYDGLRTVDAQEKMLRTQRVQDNPHWLEEPRLLSPPGMGGHPRGMAIDVSLEDDNGQLLDMGTAFDYLSENANPIHNPAHRQHTRLTRQAVKNRTYLTHAMVTAAEQLQIPLLPLPQEWWDFRLPVSVYDQYAPLKDADLPDDMKMVSG